jgi:hypothetical protein
MDEQKSEGPHPLLAAYVVLGILTLIFQIYVRTGPCALEGDCALSYAKAVVWAVIWPASWFVFLSGALASSA